MTRITVGMLAVAMLGLSQQVDAQGRNNRPDRRDRQDRQEIARAQGVPPGQLPPSGRCRVWYDDRAAGRQPSPTTCREAELVASGDRRARVIYGDARAMQGQGYGHGSSTNDRAVGRNGRDRDPRIARDPRVTRDNRSTRFTTPAFQSGYRDGLAKGRDDGEDNDRYDPARHSWYKSATRGYEDEYGSKTDFQVRYREGFDAGYAEGYRAFRR